MRLSQIAKKMLMLSLIITAAMLLIGIIICFAFDTGANDNPTDDILPVVLGILLSELICIVKVFLLNYQVGKLTKMDDPNKARMFGTGHGLLRFVLTGGGLVAAHFIPFTNLIAAIAGAFTFNIAAYALNFVNKDEDDPPLPPPGQPGAEQPETESEQPENVNLSHQNDEPV